MNEKGKIKKGKEFYINKYNEKKKDYLLITAKLIYSKQNNKYQKGGYYDGYNSIILTEKNTSLIEVLINNLLKLKNNIIIVYFENLNTIGQYIYEELIKKNDLSLNIISKDEDIFEIKINNKLLIRNLTKILPINLEETTKMLNLTINKEEITLEKELKLLYECIIEYRKELYKISHLDILNSLTIPSFSLKYYRKIFLIEREIIKNTYDQDEFIRQSYLGGIVDVYKPYGQNLYFYDINSFYPYMMTLDLPSGKGIWIKDNIILENFFGFIKVKITHVPKTHIPFLIKKDKDYGLISPIGKWEGVYFSEELKKAKKMGYHFKIIKGIQFVKKKLLKNFISILYFTRRMNKDNPKGNIYKLIMNSLYGKFGRNNQIQKVDLVEEKRYIYISNLFPIIKEMLINNKYLIQYENTPIPKKLIYAKKLGYISQEEFEKEIQKKYQSRHLNKAVHIAAAITSYARIHMHKFKTLYNNQCYYTDTDSVFLEKPLDPKYVSKEELGKMKLVTKCEEAIFLSSKVYGYKENELIKIVYAGMSNKENITLKQLKEGLQKKNVKQNRNEITYLKREKIINHKGEWIDTKPIELK